MNSIVECFENGFSSSCHLTIPTRKRGRFQTETDEGGTDEMFRTFKRPCQDVVELNPLHYWMSLGLRKSQCAAAKLENSNDYTQIYDDIKHRNNIFFKNYDSEPVLIPIWSIDGTCATGKSSSIPNIFKTNAHMKIFGINSHPYSSIGYYYTSCKILKEKLIEGVTVTSDRTPYNNIYPWYSIWQMISLVKDVKIERTINSYVEELTKTELEFIPNLFSDIFLNKLQACMELAPDHTLNTLVNTTKTILVVDSNEAQVRKRLARRNESSDLERSKWDFYITLQNYAYAYMALKYPKQFLLIDINRYNNNMSLVQEVIRDLVKIPVPEKKDSMMFKPLRFTKPISLTVLAFQQAERIRPMVSGLFYNSIKNITI